ncbi:hypothetical protein [uncultured Psychrobacter sp.]|uniref:hypothetical protein n=1 Tax=uncultured Psychrobacter sp. TaxID=259303 RepID=UPI002593DD88|nr:hypothetical protein [uncultured Psychrobacter sp.]
MTAYYTQAQIDEIGALIGQEILNSNEALKQFVQDKIAALEPVTPPAPTEPEAGDGTTPAPAAGTFLDDGREIKTRLLQFTAQTGNNNIPISGIHFEKILGYRICFRHPDGGIFNENYDQTGQYYGSQSYMLNDTLTVNIPDSEHVGKVCFALITYLA